MRLLRSTSLAVAALSAFACAQDIPNAGFQPEQEVLLEKTQEKFEFQSDIARLMRVVVSHLYHDRDVFLRELISNSGDALEKLRFASLTDSSVLDSAPSLNISIIADKPGKRLIIRDSGVGMTRDELQKNLGTIARSGTADFLAKLETSSEGSNLIGQFGLGFYSSFLVADKVVVASKSNADDKQWVFESEADKGEFKIAEDPRGLSLGRGTEISLYIKDDAIEFLEPERLRSLISTHSEFSTQAPIFLWTEKEEEVPIEEPKEPDSADDEVKVDEEELTENEKPKTKTVKTADWVQVNTKGPVWTRDSKTVSDEEYIAFYRALTNDIEEPNSWTHFKGDAGQTSFTALIYIPNTLPNDFYSKTYAQLDAVRLFVRRVLITKEPSSDFLPKWLNWIKVVIDADDLPLNVGRDSLQANRSLRQIQNALVRKFLDHLINMASREPENYSELWKVIGTTLKVGSVEDHKNRDRLNKLLRFASSVKDQASLDDYVARRKKGQKQIFFIAGAGMDPTDLARSPFVEKLVARGYEVLYLVDPMDEMITSALGSYGGMRFQDVAKKGLLMGDEDEATEEKAEMEVAKEQYAPLIEWIKRELEAHVSDVVISNRLTMSPCAVVTDSYAWTGNMERLIAAQNSRGDSDMALNFIRNAKKTFEINPKHPLIEGLLAKVKEAEGDSNATKDLRETVTILWDTALVRSGYSIKDTNMFFERIEHLLRKSLGVSETARVKDANIRPAPPVEVGPVGPSREEAIDVPNMPKNDEDWAEWADLKKKFSKDGTAMHSTEGPAEGTPDKPVVQDVKQTVVDEVLVGEGETSAGAPARDEL